MSGAGVSPAKPVLERVLMPRHVQDIPRHGRNFVCSGKEITRHIEKIGVTSGKLIGPGKKDPARGELFHGTTLVRSTRIGVD